MSVPKSELLRNALEARRAQNTPIQSSSKPAPIDALPPRPAAPTPSARPLQLQTPAASPDAFDEFDLPEDLMTPESPIRKRRAREKDDTPPRGKTNLELSAEIEKLREEVMTEKMRCELLKNNNKEIQARYVKAREEMEQLQSLEVEMHELEAENRQLKDTLEAHQEDMDLIDDMNDHIERLQSEGAAVEKEKQALEKEKQALTEEVTNLKNDLSEGSKGAKELEEAMAEAADIIDNLENEKLGLEKKVDSLERKVDDLESGKLRLTKEIGEIRTMVAALESKEVDGSSKYPQQPFVDTSLDEHRPATSYDDSDYYSQPATPRADIDRDAQSIRSATSARSKQFIELTRERTRSARSLSKRMSDASLRAASVVSAVHAPEVPNIPEKYAEVTPRTVDERFRERRYQQSGTEQIAAGSRADMRRPTIVAPVQTHQPSGLRSVYRPDQMQRSSTSRPSSSHKTSSSKTSRPHTRGNSAVEPVPVPPPRMSSRHAHTSSSEDRLRPQPSDATLESNTTCGTLIGTEEQKQEQVLTAWTSANPRTSTVSLLTASPRIDLVDKERWWKDTEHVRPLRTRATTRTLRADFSSDEGDSGLETFAVRADGVRTTPTTPAAETPPEKDFLFNPRETEDQFMRKTIMKLKGSMRRRHNESL